MIPFLHIRLVQCVVAMAVLGIANPQSLREAALARNILVGAAVRPSLFSEAAYSATLGREFNMVQAEDVMKWWTVRHTAGAFDFREGDQVVQFALAHRMKVRGHCLVWDHNNPEWLAQGHFTPAQLSQLLQEHIATVMKHNAARSSHGMW
jgi:endo-1,4-beta-xylanase